MRVKNGNSSRFNSYIHITSNFARNRDAKVEAKKQMAQTLSEKKRQKFSE